MRIEIGLGWVVMSGLLLGLLSASENRASAAEGPQVGLNFVRFAWVKRGRHAGPSMSDADILADLSQLQVDAVRQLVRADLLWREVEPQDNVWDFSRADKILSAVPGTPIVTLFSMQYASATPPWAEPGAFQRTLGPEAKNYLDTVVRRYRDQVRYWEIGNEMDHWRAADPGSPKRPDAKAPPHAPPGGFSPAEQGAFLAEVADFIRARDPDAVIVMPGMGGLSPYVLQTWLPGVIAGAGKDAFDVVNYHYYGPWERGIALREGLASRLTELGLGSKPVWLTETGSTASPSLRLRTDYPNGPPSQAADVFRRTLPAWAAGDSLVLWHTHVSSPQRPQNRWQLYGLRQSDGRMLPSWYSFKLLTTEVTPFAAVTPMAGLGSGQYGYRVQRRDGTLRWVFWGRGSVQAPVGAQHMTSVAPSAGGFQWQAVGQSLVLSLEPILLR
jgi:hypothetical protein